MQTTCVRAICHLSAVRATRSHLQMDGLIKLTLSMSEALCSSFLMVDRPLGPSPKRNTSRAGRESSAHSSENAHELFVSPTRQARVSLHSTRPRRARRRPSRRFFTTSSPKRPSRRLDVVEARIVSRIAPKRDLRVAKLFAPDLKAWGSKCDNLIETSKSSYAQTVLWSQAIHRARLDLDGLIWTSRQRDPDQCISVFEDRVSAADFNILGSTR